MFNQEKDNHGSLGSVIFMLFLFVFLGLFSNNSIAPAEKLHKFELSYNSSPSHDSLSNGQLVPDLKSLVPVANQLNPKACSPNSVTISTNTVHQQVKSLCRSSALLKPDLICRFYKNYYTSTEDAPVLS